VTPAEASQRIRRFRSGYRPAVLAAARRAGRQAQRLALTKYMQPKDPDPRIDPPNPPPGPLARRRGNLARTVRLMPSKFAGRKFIIGGLEMGGTPAVRYGRIHELGGMAGRGLRSRIPARPVLGPAIREVDVPREIRMALARFASQTLGPLWSNG